MFSLLKTAISVGSTTFTIAKVIAVAVPLLIASHTGTWWLAEYVGGTRGVLKEQARVLKVELALAQNHSRWLVEVAEQNATEEAANAKVEAENAVVVGTELTSEIQKLSDSGVCIPAHVLRPIARLR